MALGLVNSNDFELELALLTRSHVPVTIANVEHVEIKHGRGSKEETPQIVRELVAAEAVCGADVKQLAHDFNISESSISAYKNGATSTSTYNKPDERLKQVVDETKENIKGIAQQKLIQAIGAIDLSGKLKPNIASAVARDMSTVVDKMSPKADEGNRGNQVNVMIYKPRMKDEDDYEIIEVAE